MRTLVQKTKLMGQLQNEMDDQEIMNFGDMSEDEEEIENRICNADDGCVDRWDEVDDGAEEKQKQRDALKWYFLNTETTFFKVLDIIM